MSAQNIAKRTDNSILRRSRDICGGLYRARTGDGAEHRTFGAIYESNVGAVRRGYRRVRVYPLVEIQT